MTGSWTVQLADGPHTITAGINRWTGQLKITYDGLPIDSSFVLIAFGQIRQFEKDGHSFALHITGLGMFGHLVLSVDGTDVDATAASVQPTAQPPAHPPSAPARAAAAAASAAAPAIQFVKELSAVDGDEVLGIEEYPLDNTFGDSPLTTDRQVSKESRNDFSAQFDHELHGKLGLTLFTALSTELAARVSEEIGFKIGETVTESQTLHFSVRERSAVVYEVIWKRKVRNGEHVYLANNEPVTVPYRVDYGLSCEVRTSALKRDESTSGG